MKRFYNFLPLALFLISCSSQKPKLDYHFIAIPDVVNNDPSKALTAEQVAYDLSQTTYALDKAYSGKKFLPNGEYKFLVQKIQEISGPQKASQLCEKLDRLMDQVSDSHLNAKFEGENCFKSPNKKLGNVGRNFYSDKNGIPWKIELRKRGKSTALLISITQFHKSSSPVWNGFIDEVKKQIPNANFLVIDLRRNGGGDDAKGSELSNLLAGAPLKSPYAAQWTNSSPESKQLFVNTFESWARSHRAKGKEVPPYILDLKKQFLDQLAKSPNSTKWFEDRSDENAGKDFVLAQSIQKPIYILMDAECASSCESTIDYFEYNTLVKTVGQPTAGYIHFGNNGNVQLKNSGIELQMAISYNSYRDGRFLEKMGIKPKIAVPPGKDALEFAWADFVKN